MNALIYNCSVDASAQWILDRLMQKSSRMNALIYNCLGDTSVQWDLDQRKQRPA